MSVKSRRSYNSVRRSEQAGATRARILETAESLFISLGYAAVTMENIARHASVSIATAYLYFPGKAAIVEAMAEAVVSAADLSVEQIERETDPVEQLRSGARIIRLLNERSWLVADILRSARGSDEGLERSGRRGSSGTSPQTAARSPPSMPTAGCEQDSGSTRPPTPFTLWPGLTYTGHSSMSAAGPPTGTNGGCSALAVPNSSVPLLTTCPTTPRRVFLDPGGSHRWPMGRRRGDTRIHPIATPTPDEEGRFAAVGAAPARSIGCTDPSLRQRAYRSWATGPWVERSMTRQFDDADLGKPVERELHGEGGEQEAEHHLGDEQAVLDQVLAHLGGPAEHDDVEGEHRDEGPDDDRDDAQRPASAEAVTRNTIPAGFRR